MLSNESNQCDRYLNLYNKGIGKLGDKLHNELIDPIINKGLKNVVNLKKKVCLDLGYGNGYFERKYSNKFKNIIAIDSSEKLLIKAEINKPEKVDFVFSDVTRKLPFKEKYFDVVVSVMVVQYFPKLDNVLKEAERILKMAVS